MPEAYNAGLARTAAPVCLLAHQDVYLPAGFLDRMIAVLCDLTVAHPDWMVAGPYGVTPQGRHVGRVWDVAMGRELGQSGAPAAAVDSLDELLLILRRPDGYRFDENLREFHMYGTDLVQTAWAMKRSAWAVELPVVHNNRPLRSLRGSYARAYYYMREKWRAKLPIHTVCCVIAPVPWSLWRTQWRRFKAKIPKDHLLADAPRIARAAGYE